MGGPFISWDNLSVKSAPFYPSIKYMNLVKVKHSAVLGLLCHFCVLFWNSLHLNRKNTNPLRVLASAVLKHLTFLLQSPLFYWDKYRFTRHVTSSKRHSIYTLPCLVTKLCPTLCDPMDCSPQGSSVHGISQERTLEWVAVSFSRGSSWPRDWAMSPAWQVDSSPLSHWGSQIYLLKAFW